MTSFEIKANQAATFKAISNALLVIQNELQNLYGAREQKLSCIE